MFLSVSLCPSPKAMKNNDMLLVLSSDFQREVFLQKHLVDNLCVFANKHECVKACVYEGFLW